MNELELSKAEEKWISEILEDERFTPFLKIQNYLIQQWKNESAKRDTEFETVWAMADREGKINGVNAFLDALEGIQQRVFHRP